MLSVKQQKFLLMLLERKVRRRENKLYTSSTAFYRIVGYLKRNGLVQSTKHGREHSYELTIKGTLTARILANLDDVEENIRKKYGMK